MGCLFCEIIAGKIPAIKIFENEEVLGFKDIQPQAPIHYLFVPKKHYESLAMLPKQDLHIMSSLTEALLEVAEKEKIKESGFRTVINTNKFGGQSVYHLHIHLIAGRPLGGNMTGV